VEERSLTKPEIIEVGISSNATKKPIDVTLIVAELRIKFIVLGTVSLVIIIHHQSRIIVFFETPEHLI
tara:strand:- start:43 stop:246 length:204 start_codon:yes stop_codon:yes gene_type:complete